MNFIAILMKRKMTFCFKITQMVKPLHILGKAVFLEDPPPFRYGIKFSMLDLIIRIYNIMKLILIICTVKRRTKLVLSSQLWALLKQNFAKVRLEKFLSDKDLNSYL